MYADDWDGFLPQQGYLPWQLQIYGMYVPASPVFECPSFERKFNPKNHPAWPVGGGFNMNILKSEADSWPHESEFEDPAETVYVHDGNGAFTVHAGSYGFNVINGRIASENELVLHGVAPRHHKEVNVLYLDGHAKWCTLGHLTQYSLWTMEGD